MFEILKFIGYFLERSEKNSPRIFWLCTTLLGFCIFQEPLTTSSESQIVIEPVLILYVVVAVLGICSRGNKKNVNSFDKLMSQMYDLNIQY